MAYRIGGPGTGRRPPQHRPDFNFPFFLDGGCPLCCLHFFEANSAQTLDHVELGRGAKVFARFTVSGHFWRTHTHAHAHTHTPCPTDVRLTALPLIVVVAADLTHALRSLADLTNLQGSPQRWCVEVGESTHPPSP